MHVYYKGISGRLDKKLLETNAEIKDLLLFEFLDKSFKYILRRYYYLSVWGDMNEKSMPTLI